MDFNVGDLVTYSVPANGCIYQVETSGPGWISVTVIFQMTGEISVEIVGPLLTTGFEPCSHGQVRDMAMALLKLTPAWRPSPLPVPRTT